MISWGDRRTCGELSKDDISALMKKSAGYLTDVVCPKCGENLEVKVGYSKFIGCSNFPNCTFILNPQPKYSNDFMNFTRSITRDHIDDYFTKQDKDKPFEAFESYSDEEFDFWNLPQVNCSDDM